MFADGHPIVFFKNMSMKMTGIDPGGDRIRCGAKKHGPQKPMSRHGITSPLRPGRPSWPLPWESVRSIWRAYRIFDHDRKIARLPGPPYCFMDRVIHLEPEPWVLEPGGWVTAQYDIPENEWYFAADRSGRHALLRPAGNCPAALRLAGRLRRIRPATASRT
jgi:hypothetical protein